ncbi:MAG: hypothetical protein ACLFUQ_02385 [Candidatus Izemoplasmataceae bacterium]
MKTRLLWILPLAVLLLIIVLYTMVPQVYRFWFNLRHILVYGLSGYVLTMGLFLVLKALLNKFNPSKGVKFTLVGFFSLGLVGFLVLLSNLQMQYITLYEVPPLESCAYYDDHGNFIYASQYEGACSDPSEVHIDEVDGQETLTFMLEETFSGPARTVSLITGDIGVEAYHLEAVMHAEVTITYAAKRHVKSVEVLLQETQHKINDYDGRRTTVGNLEYKRLENEIEENTVTITTKSGSETFNEEGHGTIDFPDKETLNMEETVLQSVVYPKDEHADYIDITKSNPPEEGVPDTYLSRGEYRTLNDPLFILDFYEDGRFSGTRVDAYYELDAITLSSRNEDDQWAGVEQEQATRMVSFESPKPHFIDGAIALDDFHLLSGFKADLDDSMHPGPSYTVDYRMTDDETYAIHEGTTSKFLKTDYGFKVEDYSTRRYSNGSYYPSLNMDQAQESVLIEGLDQTLKTMYDYETMLYSPGRLSDYHFYQRNYLLEGHIMAKD